jgi:type I restriction enzyme M protein
MANERNTENLVRDALRKLKYGQAGKGVQVEEQITEIETASKLLRAASKSGKGGKGSPEFIISDPDSSKFLIIIECKADVRHHVSKGRDQPVTYAVDGALHYARFLSKEYTVIAVAISGQTKSQLRISTYLHAKGGTTANELMTKTGAAIDKLIPWKDYIEHASFDPTVQKLRHDELMAFSRDLHEFMFDYAKLAENEKPLLVSGTLLALQNEAFAKSFDAYSPEDLQQEWLKVIKAELNKAQLLRAKKDSLMQPYSAIAVHPELGKPTPMHPKGTLYPLIKQLNEKVRPFISVYHDFDVVGQFYGEFLKYTGGDKKALGIVLTPRHVTDLFARLANVTKTSTVLDTCAGTGSFLISAMHHMSKSATTAREIERIKRMGLVGVEQQPNMFALAASNMILRGDGKANLYQGSCFDKTITNALKKHHCDVGMINPPYSQGADELHELVFVKHMLDCLKPGGMGMAIIPLAKVIAPHTIKAELLKAHTLEAVMSMPNELFYPVGRITCIVVFRAHEPHAQSKRKTWFSYWKDDGYVKTKHLGRVDLHGKWAAIRDRWVSEFRNKDERIGLSIKQTVGPDDEWCAEAYMETDYKQVRAINLQAILKRHLSYRLMETEHFEESLADIEAQNEAD